MKSIFEFLNDYRDTIYYGISAVIIATMIYHGHYAPKAIIDSVFDLVWLREFSRNLAWIAVLQRGTRSILYSHVVAFIFFGDICLNPYQYIHMRGSWWWHLVMVLNVIYFLRAYLNCGGARAAAHIYRKELFDWPRKQKPPKHRWQSIARKCEDFMEKFRPDFVPSPAGCRVVIK